MVDDDMVMVNWNKIIWYLSHNLPSHVIHLTIYHVIHLIIYHVIHLIITLNSGLSASSSSNPSIPHSIAHFLLFEMVDGKWDEIDYLLNIFIYYHLIYNCHLPSTNHLINNNLPSTIINSL